MVILCYTPRYRGNSHHTRLRLCPIRSGQAGPGPTICPHPLLQRSEGTEGGSIESGETKKLIGPQTVKPRPPFITPEHPIGCLHHSQKESEPFSHWSPQPQAGKAVFPLVSFDNTPTVSHSAAANQVTVQYLWNFLE